MQHYSLATIANEIGAELRLNGVSEQTQVDGLATLDGATATQMTFLANPKYAEQMATTKAIAIIVNEEGAALCQNAAALVMDNPYLGFAQAAFLFDDTPKAKPGVHPSAVVDDTCKLGERVAIGPNCTIAAGVVLGNDVVIGANCVIDEHCVIGDNTVLKANVSLYHKVRLGRDCIVHSGAVIGSDGFGNAQHEGRWVKIPQLGTVVIGDDVEIGANTTIDRGALGDTIIGENVRLDNLVQIAHNVEIGDHSAMAAMVGIAGSTKIGRHCLFGGQCGVNGHITIGDKVMLTATTSVSKSLPNPGVYSSGIPMKESKAWAKQIANIRRLDKMKQRLTQLEKQLKESHNE